MREPCSQVVNTHSLEYSNDVHHNNDLFIVHNLFTTTTITTTITITITTTTTTTTTTTSNGTDGCVVCSLCQLI